MTGSRVYLAAVILRSRIRFLWVSCAVGGQGLVYFSWQKLQSSVWLQVL